MSSMSEKSANDAKDVPCDPATLIRNYSDMVLIRRFEETVGRLYGMGLIGGFCHLYIGQEAVVVGVQSEINTGVDQVVTSYRDHGHILVCGEDPCAVMAELMGRKDGCSKGKGGSMHMFHPQKGFYGGHGIVGSQVSIGTGMAFANRYRENNSVCVVYYGDGAANQGQVYESFNLASLWQLPVLYVVENNLYAMGTSVERSTVSLDLFRRGEVYGIPGKAVDGMNVIAVRKATQEAVSNIRAGKGPFLLEMQTYRYRGHSMSDPSNYRDRKEVQDIRQNRDPITNLKKFLLDSGYADESVFKSIEGDIKEKVAEAARVAQDSLPPDISDLHTDVHANSCS